MANGFLSISGRMKFIVEKFENDPDKDVFDLLDQVGRSFPHWTSDMILTYTARYLRQVNDDDTAEHIIFALDNP